MRPSSRSHGPAAVARLLPALAAAWLALAPAASAHDTTFPIAGTSILIQTNQGAGAEVFQLAATGVPLLDHDPRQDGTALLVRGTGENAGRSALVNLDRNLWAATAAGFAYSDPQGTRGGVTSVVLEPPSLSVVANGAAWGWSPAGAQDDVWVHLRLGDTGFCTHFPAEAASTNAEGHFEASGAAAPPACPAQVCGDGIPQAGEQCDDGNLATGDGCEATCETGPCNAQSFPSTFEAIQTVVFEGGYGCTDGTCHDSVAPKNELELTHAVAYDELLGPTGTGQPSDDYPFLKLIEPGEPELSYLFIKLAAKTYPAQTFVVDPGTAMPSGGLVALSQDHLEAVRRWIRGGAPREGVVEGTQELLGTCLPAPTPLKIPVPDPPAPGTGIQLQQTPWDLPATTPETAGEDEICMSTYYDVSAIVPEWAKVPCPEGLRAQLGCSNAPATACTSDDDCVEDGVCVVVKNANNPGDECFVYHAQTLIQDPQSHHSIIQLYTGAYPLDDPGWGEWTKKLEPTDPDYALSNGMPCDPTDVDPAKGFHPGCSGAVVSSVACGGYGPADANQFSVTGRGGNLEQFSGSQEPFYEQTLADGVYAIAPLRGVVVWNSHAFNLTDTPSTMAQYLNLDFATPEDQLYPLRGIFDARWIFAQDVPPFGTQEICATHTIEEGARLFELSSHTHVRGVRWRTWGPPNEPCQPGCPESYFPQLDGFFRACSPDPALPICDGPREDQPLYFSSDYSDPLQLDFDPPLAFDDPDVADRTFLFCSLFDNGSDIGSPPVKRRSTSPFPPDIPGLATGQLLNQVGVGGPCPRHVTVCADGPSKGEVCGTASTLNHGMCGDPAQKLCDACPARGGVTTEDEMFILLGSYYVPTPEPGAAGL
ncbi:MAG: hypothetical protein DCC71_24680, partial [Proteobacteria bacterium]